MMLKKSENDGLGVKLANKFKRPGVKLANKFNTIFEEELVTRKIASFSIQMRQSEIPYLICPITFFLKFWRTQVLLWVH